MNRNNRKKRKERMKQDVILPRAPDPSIDPELDSERDSETEVIESHEKELAVRTRPRAGLQRYATFLGDRSTLMAWTFPVVLAAVCILAVTLVLSTLSIWTAPVGEPLTARLTWAVTAMLFITFLAFGMVACHVVMFRCGRPDHAVLGAGLAAIIGVGATIAWGFNNDSYWGPPLMRDYLNATAFCFSGVRMLTGVFDGLATWAATVLVFTSAVILANDVDETVLRDQHGQRLPPAEARKVQEEELSRQLRGSKIIMYAAAALLITGVSEVAALHKWPQYETAPIPGCENDAAKALYATPTSIRSTIEPTAIAISSSIGAVASLVLVSAYLPLAILLRQRAYRVIKPWQRAEAWLAIHGFALQPTQQLAKILLILSPLLAGGPINYLISLLNQ